MDIPLSDPSRIPINLAKTSRANRLVSFYQVVSRQFHFGHSEHVINVPFPLFRIKRRRSSSIPQSKIRNPKFSLIPQWPFFFCSGEYYIRLVEELRPLTYSLVGRKTKLMPKDEWAACLGHSPDVADALIQSMIVNP